MQASRSSNFPIRTALVSAIVAPLVAACETPGVVGTEGTLTPDAAAVSPPGDSGSSDAKGSTSTSTPTTCTEGPAFGMGCDRDEHCATGEWCNQSCMDNCDQTVWPNACCERHCMPKEATACEPAGGVAVAPGSACPAGFFPPNEAADWVTKTPGMSCCLPHYDCKDVNVRSMCEVRSECQWWSTCGAEPYPNPGTCQAR